MRKTTILAAVCIAAAGASIGVFAGVAQGGPDQDEANVSANQPVAEFDAARNGEDSLPAVAAKEIADMGPPGTDALKSLRALASGGWDVYLVPASDGACVALADPQGGASVTCHTNRDLSTGPASPAAVLTGCNAASAAEAPVCSEAILWGLAPNGYSDVTVDVKSGAAPTTKVVNNAYLVRVPLAQSPHAIRFEGDGATVERPVGVSTLGY